MLKSSAPEISALAAKYERNCVMKKVVKMKTVPCLDAKSFEGSASLPNPTIGETEKAQIMTACLTV